MGLCCGSLISCTAERATDPKAFREIYAAYGDRPQLPAETQQAPAPRITRSYHNATMYQVARDFAEITKRSIIISENADAKTVTAEFRDEAADVALGTIARRIGQQLSISGQAYYIGEPQTQDRTVLVRSIPRLTPEQMQNVVGVYLSEGGRAYATPEGLLVVGDKLQVTERISHMLNLIEEAPIDTWVVQAYIVQRSSSRETNAGLDVVPAAKLAAAVGNAAAIPSGITAAAQLDATLKAALTQADSRILTAPLLLVAEGQAAKLKSGVTLPIITTTTSPEGTVQVTGYTPINIGTDIKFTVRRMDEHQARLQCDIVLGQLQSIDKNGFPTTTSEELSVPVTVKSGGVYLVGSLSQNSATNQLSGPLALEILKTKSDRKIDVWVRTYRIGGPPKTARADLREEKPKGKPVTIFQGVPAILGE